MHCLRPMPGHSTVSIQRASRRSSGCFVCNECPIVTFVSKNSRHKAGPKRMIHQVLGLLSVFRFDV